MDVNNILFRTKIRTSCSRCDALKAHLVKYRSRGQVSPAIVRVVEKLEIALDAVKDRLTNLPKNPDLSLLNDNEAEKTVQLTSRYIVTISNMAALIENSDASSVPAEVALALRRIVQTLFSKTELIVIASPEINYSIGEICQYLRPMLQQLQCKIESDFPDKIFRIAVPLVKGNHALQYPILAHEIGHHLYEHYKVFKSLEPIRIDLQQLTDWFKSRQHGEAGQGTPQSDTAHEEVTLREFFTKPVNDMVVLWLRELASDMYGLILMGPAFITALLDLSLPVLPLDRSAPDHPPTRFRIRVLLDCMETLYKLDSISPNLRTAIDSWKAIAYQESKMQSLLDGVVLANLNKEELLGKLWKHVQESLNATIKYSPKTESVEVQKILELVDADICPVSYTDHGKQVFPKVASVLNAGWEATLGELESYRSNLSAKVSKSQQLVEEKFDAFLLKALELNEVQQYWNEARHGIIREEDQGNPV